VAGCKRPGGDRPRAASGAAPAGAGGTPPLLGGPHKIPAEAGVSPGNN